MSETLSSLPFPFWIAALALLVAFILSAQRIHEGVGLPMMAVLGTVGFWYMGDAFYNDYAHYHAQLFQENALDNAWWQVAWFVAAFVMIAPMVHESMNRRYAGQRSGVLWMFRNGVDDPVFQGQLKQLFRGSVVVWVVIAVLAAIRIQSEVMYFLFPFLGHNAAAFGRARIGTGFDAVFTLIFYFHELAAAGFGVVAGGSTDRRMRLAAIVFVLLSWPAFLFDRTRNNMLVVIMPGIMTWGFLGLRGGIIKKVVMLALCFLVINGWMGFVIKNRSESQISDAFLRKGFSIEESQKTHHEGLNMYEELCWINTFIERGTYQINWGARYFAELVNFVPRVVWAGKPEIGINYAIARGGGGGSDRQAGVNMTVSTGLIGQSVVNFGGFLGPPFAALLMSIWCALLARLDLNAQQAGNIPLYGLGLILTFNTGRDISLIVLYPFVFGWLIMWWRRRKGSGKGSMDQPSATATIDRIDARKGREVKAMVGRTLQAPKM